MFGEKYIEAIDLSRSGSDTGAKTDTASTPVGATQDDTSLSRARPLKSEAYSHKTASTLAGWKAAWLNLCACARTEVRKEEKAEDAGRKVDFVDSSQTQELATQTPTQGQQTTFEGTQPTKYAPEPPYVRQTQEELDEIKFCPRSYK